MIIAIGDVHGEFKEVRWHFTAEWCEMYIYMYETSR